MGNEENWNVHMASDKHSRCIESLNALGLYGEFNQVLGCKEPGVLGDAIEPSELSQTLAVSYGFADGGKPNKGTSLIGLKYVRPCAPQDGSQQPDYKCVTCNEVFKFLERATHLKNAEHQTRYLERYYPDSDWYKELCKIDPSETLRRSAYLAFVAHQIDELESPTESQQVKEMKY